MNMPVLAVAFLAGDLLLQQAGVLPAVSWGWLILPLLGLLAWPWGRRRLVVPAVFAVGYLWALCLAHWQLAPGLPASLEGRDVTVVGRVIGLPRQLSYGVRFELVSDTLRDARGNRMTPPRRLRLTWHHPLQPVEAGQRWRLHVRLKRPHGFMNPGGFDYEGWLYREGVQATGYVRRAAGNRLLGETFTLDRLRQHLAASIRTSLPGGRFTGVLEALVVGARGDVPQDQWRIWLATGTNHLMAISGLHIGLVAGLVFAVAMFFWRRVPWLCLRMPAMQAAAVAGLLAATGYALLAGLSLPTQRALIMLAVVMGALLVRREIRPLQTLSLALFAVLVFDPLAVLSPGFWFSFFAVGVIFYLAGGRVRPVRGLRQWGRIQFWLTLGLLPLTLWFFQRGVLVGALANLVAVPVVSLLVVPLALIGTLALQAYAPLGHLLLWLAQGVLSALWPLLTLLAGLPFAQWHAPAAPFWALVLAVLGVAVIMAPRGLPGRWLGALLLLPLLGWQPSRPAIGNYRLTLLDVGEGLAAVVRTHGHTLVFDTGPRFSPSFDTGAAVVVPYLRNRGIRTVDALIVSHGDNDHAGGAASVIRLLSVHRVLSSAHRFVASGRARPCLAGQHWRWDGVAFEMLNPPQGLAGSRNNRACVLRVSSPAGSLLLASDIERPAEERLLAAGDTLHSDVLVVPHHGSRTSSSPAFLAAVHPRLALLSMGYRNRYHFPSREVTARYAARRIRLADTCNQGALQVDFRGGAGPRLSPGYRLQARHYWNNMSGCDLKLGADARFSSAPQQVVEKRHEGRSGKAQTGAKAQFPGGK
jgi:competence protein ComEC